MAAVIPTASTSEARLKPTVRYATVSPPATRVTPTKAPSFGRPQPRHLASLVVAATALAAGSARAAGGDFSNIDFAAAAPFTYDHATGGGAYNDRTVGKHDDITEQLEGGEFACGDVVSFLSHVDVDPAAVDPNQTIDLDYRFLGDSTGQSGAAQSEIVGVRVN